MSPRMFSGVAVVLCQKTTKKWKQQALAQQTNGSKKTTRSAKKVAAKTNKKQPQK